MDPHSVDRIIYCNSKAPDALGRLPHDSKGSTLPATCRWTVMSAPTSGSDPGRHDQSQSPDTPSPTGYRQLRASASDRIYQAAGNQFIVERHQRRPPVAVVNTLTRATRAFTGRIEEVESIITAVAESAQRNVAMAVHTIDGMPGVGKTALALHVAHLLEPFFPDGQFFLGLRAHTPNDGPVEPADALAALLTADGMHPKHVSADPDLCATQWRARMAGKKVLLVMDDAVGHAQVEPLLPGAPGCLVLITSRRRLTGLSARHATANLSLDVLLPMDAEALFTHLIRRDLTGSELEAVPDVVRLCGYLPLAISLLAAKLNPEPRWKVNDLLDELVATHDRLVQFRGEDIAVAAAFDMSYRDLPAARRQFFRCLGLHPGTDFGVHTAAALDGVTAVEAQEHLEALYEDHLIDQPLRGRYRMHDLIGAYARARAEADRRTDSRQALRQLLSFYQRTVAYASSLIHPHPGGRTTSDPHAEGPALPAMPSPHHAARWIGHELTNLFACVAYAKDHGDHSFVDSMSDDLAVFLQRTGPWSQAIDLHHTAALMAGERGDLAAQANALHNLGVVRTRICDYAAATEVLHQALAILQKVPDPHNEARVLDQLSIVRRLVGHFAEAADVAEQALSLSRQVDDRHGVARTLNNLAMIRWLIDDFRAAAEAADEALAIFRDLDDRLGQADALFRLGVVHRMTNDYVGASRALHQAHAIYQEFGDRLGQANTVHNLGVVAQMTGDPQATRILHEALAMYEDLGDRLGQANALKYLGAVWSLTGPASDADEVLQRAMAMYTDLDDPLGQAGVLRHLGTVMRLGADTAGAVAAYDKALRIYRDLGSRLGQAEVLNEIAKLSLEQGNTSQARARYERARRQARAAGNRLEEAYAIEGLALCAVQRGDLDRAIPQLRQAAHKYQQIGGAAAIQAAARLLALVDQPPPAASA
jgi:tetratricopeptide (TPR) repeat protein